MTLNIDEDFVRRLSAELDRSRELLVDRNATVDRLTAENERLTKDLMKIAEAVYDITVESSLDWVCDDAAAPSEETT